MAQNKPTTGKYETRAEWEKEVKRLFVSGCRFQQIVDVTGSPGYGPVRNFLNKSKRRY